MALVKGTNCGFVTSAPSGDPGGGGAVADGSARAMKADTPAGAAKIVEIGWYCGEATEEANYEVGIYDHNSGDNNPEALVGSDTVNAKGTGTGWKRVTGLNIAVSGSTTYWIAVQLDNTATATRIDYDNDAGEKADQKTIQTQLTEPWGVSGFTDASLMAIYAVYEEAAAESGENFVSLASEGLSDNKSPELSY
jgi:hypothetical protein